MHCLSRSKCSSSSKPVKIAIADDSASIRRVVRQFIESKTDWQVCGEADNGEAAVCLAGRQQPNLLVLDLSMPVMNGLQAARKIAGISPKTRIVLFTGYPTKQVQKEAKSAGIRAVLSKDEDSSLQHLLTTLNEAKDNIIHAP